MKTTTGNTSSASPKILLVAILASGLFLAGCVVTSVYPYYSDKDVVFEPALLGDWTDGKSDGNTNDVGRVEQFGQTGYRLTSLGENETNSVNFHVFRLGQQLFMDMCPTNQSLELLPTHQLQKVKRTGMTLEIASLNYDWLEKLLEKNPKAIRHIVVTDKNDGRDDKRIVLTADTAELQKFVLKHLRDTNAWNEPSLMKVRSAAR
jgi:hypothetical protein